MYKRYNTIIILAGGLVKDINGWRTTWFNEGDNFGALGDRFRILAGAYVYQEVQKENRDIDIIVCGGKGQLKSVADAPTVSHIMKKELIEFGVPSEKIIEENNSGNTKESLNAIQHILAKEEEKHGNGIAIISNEYHLPRIRAMIEHDEELRSLFSMISLGALDILSAEKICIENEPLRWKGLIDEAYQSRAMQERIHMEEKGIEDIRNRRYKS